MALTNNKRGIGRYIANKTIKDSFKEFKVEHPDTPYTLYRDIYVTFIQEVMCQIIEKSGDFRLFSRLGDIGIRKKKIRKELDKDGNLIHINRDINWGETLKLWEKEYGTNDKAELKKIKDKPLVRYNNKHNSGFTLKVYWDKSTSNVKNQRKYVFRPTRDFKRVINKLLKEKNLNYYEVK